MHGEVVTVKTVALHEDGMAEQADQPGGKRRVRSAAGACRTAVLRIQRHQRGHSAAPFVTLARVCKLGEEQGWWQLWVKAPVASF